MSKFKVLNNKSDWFTNLPKPPWLKVSIPKGEAFHKLRKSARELDLTTVCEEARCPNIAECWSGDPENGGRGATATFMIMGDTCTRGCKFCHIKTAAQGQPLDPDEPKKLAEGIARLDLDYIVITSVDRDELPDQGAGHFAKCVQEIKKVSPDIIVEILTPDFRGEEECLEIVANSGADVVGHNVETVRRLQGWARDHRAGYDQTMKVLRRFKEINPKIYTKSAIMVGIGETEEEVVETMQDLLDVGVSVFTIGQYLRPSMNHIPIREYVHPDQFADYKNKGEDMGFLFIASGPFVRSSYKAGELFMKKMVEG